MDKYLSLCNLPKFSQEGTMTEMIHNKLQPESSNENCPQKGAQSRMDSAKFYQIVRKSYHQILQAAPQN